MTSLFHRWLLAFAACAIFCLLSIWLFDRPIVEFISAHIPNHPFLIDILNAIVLPVPVCAGAMVWCGLAALRARPVSRLVQTLAIAGFSVTWAIVITDLMLKPLFGRLDPYDYLLGHYTFELFHGSIEASFPSGHATVLMALVSVFWCEYPPGRIYYAVAAALLLPDLMISGAHFLSDVVAGMFVGATAGLMTLALWRVRQRTVSPGPNPQQS